MPKLLFIRYKNPPNILEGGEMGTNKNLYVLSQILGDDNVTTFNILEKNLSVVQKLCALVRLPRNFYLGMTNRKMKHILHIANNYDFVYIDRSIFGVVAQYLRRAKYKGRIITFFHNVEYFYYLSRFAGNVFAKRILLRCIYNNDKLACQHSDKIILLNKRDNQQLQQLYGRSADIITPVVLRDRYAQHEQDGSVLTSKIPHCMFVGSYLKANNNGLLWFVKEVLPNVNIQFTAVGKGLAKLQKEEQSLQNINVMSDVPDLRPYYEQADIIVAPIFEGSGMKIKTCEALMYGKNILGTDEAFEGYEIDVNKIGGKCNNITDFINNITDFINNPRPKFNNFSREMFLKHYSTESVINKFKSALYE